MRMSARILTWCAAALLSAVAGGADTDVAINEVHYHPAGDCEAEEFVELYNRGGAPVDLSNWYFSEGVGFTFPEGTVFPADEYLVVARDPAALRAAFGMPDGNVFIFAGKLSNNGEDLVLMNALGEIVDRVDFNDEFPWPSSPDGEGPSLECLDPNADNGVAGNWRPAGSFGPRWRYYSGRGKAGDDLLALALSGAGEYYVDDVSLKRVGTTTELVVNGTFEEGIDGWSALGNHVNSTVTTSVAHTGGACLKLAASGAGSAGNGVTQTVAGLTLDGPEYEVSFWALRISSGVRVSMGIAGSAPVLATGVDIGNPTPTGSSSVQNGVYTVSASGSDIWGTSDQFHYRYAQLTGDGTIEGLVTWTTAQDSWSKAGLMIRETTAANSAHAMNILSRDNGACLQWRTTTGGGSEWTSGAALSGSARLRLRRVGNTFTAEAYTGGAFQQIGTTTIAMASQVLVGLCVTSHTGSSLATATFADVTVNGQGAGLSAQTESAEPTGDAQATPLAANTQRTNDLPPFIHRVHAYAPTGNPTAPYAERITSQDEVHMVATVEDDDPIASVYLDYKVIAPGAYERFADAAYNQSWQRLQMLDDGLGADAIGGDGIFTARLSAQPHRSLVRYRITAAAGTKTTNAPHPDDAVTNFAFFVYDGVPDYIANVQSAHGAVPYVHRAEDLTKVPVYHLICAAGDMSECEYLQIGFGDKVGRKDYRWRGTFVYDPMEGGERRVFENVRFRLRGGVWRYSWQKRSFKIAFNGGHHLKGSYNDGTPYPQSRGRLNLNQIIDQNWTNARGISGIGEALAMWLFRNAGTAAAHTTWIHFRTITGAVEQDQYHGDFKGLFLDMENMDDGFLNTNDRPSGNLYKIDSGSIGENGGRPGVWDKEETDCGICVDDADLEYFYDTYNGATQTEAWWQDHLDLGQYFTYRAVIDSIRHYDNQAGKNYYYYHNSVSDIWEVMPWDCDLILGWSCCGDPDTGEPFWNPVIVGYPNSFAIQYRNRFREYLQLLCNRATMDPVIDSWANLIRELHQADRDRWDYFPLPDPYPFQGRVDPMDRDPFQGLYRSLDQRLQEARTYLDGRLASVWTDTQMFCGIDAALIPATPSITSPATSPIELDPQDLVFLSSTYSDPNGNPHAATLWQAARAGESELLPRWRDIRVTNLTRCQIPADALTLGERHRVRVRYQDSTGRMSLWSNPVEITVVDSTSQKPLAVVDAAPTAGGAPLIVAFDGSRSSDPDGDTLTYSWSFGDGAATQGAQAQHTYAAIGDYTASLLVNDGRGRTDTTSVAISVRDCTGTLALALESGGERAALTLNVDAGEELTFDVKTVLAKDAGVAGVRGWSFGVAHSSAVLALDAVALAPETTARLGANSYTSTRARTDGFTQAVLLSQTTLTELPAALTELPTAVATYRLTAPHAVPGQEIRTTLRFSSAVGTPPVDVLVNQGLNGLMPCTLGELDLTILVTSAGQQRFLRGDANRDGRRDISDAVAILRRLFVTGVTLGCLDAADANDDGALDIADPVRLLGFLFAHGAPLAAPFSALGFDPTGDALDCATGL